ncbi:hypothetical protein IW261DRAFT_1675497 [Armillaria novae-zelandiae]|uniref:DUF6535 domain-containing protein n=1 Tax=Armillaria novae-zelandiae TaxID=153914 RepID=A0AA39PIJ6_9AGAR|nr:hypothetical protein IW261DRAFT_1675497 [Armillaria novae-zelandiae]
MSTASDAFPETSGGPPVTEQETTNVEAVENVAEEEDVPAPAQPYAEYVNPAKSKKRFGLKGPTPYWPPKGNDPSNYEEIFPEDAYCEELGPNARVFRTYLAERAIYDVNMVEESRDGVDVLLVFVGLFSAVVTTFVAQTSQSLQADYTEMSANLLFEMINIQHAIASGASLDTITPSPLNPNITFIASTMSVWVNGLWFTSLALSLTTALVSVLVKQWLHHYTDLPSGTKWGVHIIIGLLPTLMHTALAIFFVGLVIFLGPLRDSIAWAVSMITVVAYTAYLTAHVLPLFFPQCPYQTSLCDLLHILYSRLMQYTVDRLRCNFHRSEMNADITPTSKSASGIRQWKSLKELESQAAQSVSGELSVEALHELFSMSSNPTVQSIVLQAIGGLHPALQSKVESLFSDISLLLQQSSKECLVKSGPMYGKPLPGVETRLEQLLRGTLFLSDEYYYFNVDFDFAQNENAGNALNVKFASINRDRYPPGSMREVANNGAMAFFHSSNDEYWVFHPTIWINLIMNAASRGVFSPIAIGTQDPFAIDICCAVPRALEMPCSEDKDHTTSMVHPSPGAIPFYEAVRDYLHSDMTAYLLEMFAVFVRPSNVASIEPSLRILLVFAEFLISRIPLGKEANAAAVELRALDTVFQFISNHRHFYSHPSGVHAAVFDVLDRFIADTLTSIQLEGNPTILDSVSRIYSTLAYTKWHTMGPRSLEAVINLMFDRYYSTDYSPDYFVLLYAGKIIGKGLRKGSPTMFSVFHTAQCLEYFGQHGRCPWLLDIIEGYLSIFVPHSNSGIEASVVQEHIEYLHTPNILFDVCSILAVGDYRYHDEYRKKGIKENILALVRVQRDAPAWNDCRYRLGQLLEEDGMDFFYRQTCIDGIQRVPLSAQDIAVQRKYIRFAIETLDAFFLGTLDDEPENRFRHYATASPEHVSIFHPRGTRRSRLHQLSPWHSRHGQREAFDHDAIERV